jgi:hypothetical protein
MNKNFIIRTLTAVIMLAIGSGFTKAANNVIWNTVSEMTKDVSIKLAYGAFDNVKVGDYLYIKCNRTNQSDTWWSYSMYYGYNQPFYVASRDNNNSVFDESTIKINITEAILEKLQYKQLDWKNDVDEENSRIIIYGENITIHEISIIASGDSPTTVTTFKLTFMLDNEVFDVQYLKANDVITLPTVPDKSGYTYEWMNAPWRMPANDLVIYGFYIKLDQSVTVSVGATGYSTFCPTQPLRLIGTEDIKAYIAIAKSENEVKLSQVVGTVAAGTGLVLKGWSSNVTAQFEIAESGDTYEGNLLVGVMSAVEIKSPDQYVLVDKDGIAKFADTGYNAAVVPAGKAYLQVPSSGSRILNITFEDDETTGISVLQSTTKVQSSAYYNISGQRVVTPTKGVYVIDGKKVIIK